MTFQRRWSAAIGAGGCALLVMLWSSAVGLKDGGTVVTAAPEVLYAPEDKPAERLVARSESARNSSYIATYGLTYPTLEKAIVAGYMRGVVGCIITDRGTHDANNHRP